MSYYNEVNEFNEFNECQEMNNGYDDKNIIIQKALQKNSECDMKDMVFEYLPIEMSKNIFIKKLDISESCVISLINLPPNLEELVAINNDIEEIDDSILPKSLRVINVKNNSIKKINLQNSINLVKLICENNPIKTLLLPKTLKACSITSQILDLKDFEAMENLIVVKITKSNITNLKALSQNVKQLVIINSQINCDFPLFSSNLHRLDIINCNINSTFNFPESLAVLDLSDNKLSGSFVIPSSVIDLNISNNNITKLENIHSNLHKLNISNNDNIDITDEQLLVLKQNECNLIHDENTHNDIDHNFHKMRMFSEQERRQREIHEMMMRHKQLLQSANRNIETFTPSSSNKIIINKFCSV